MNNNIKPQYFFILGFQKSGTSTIYKWLNQIDCIKLPTNKETHFFSNSNYYNKGFNWYQEQFSNIKEPTHIGEVDPSYILSETYLKRIKSISSNNTKFIFVLRQPFERAYSHYLMSKLRGYESLSFKEAIKLETQRLINDKNNFSFLNHSYLSRSNYPIYLNMFKKIFPSHNVLYLKMNDLYCKEKKVKMLLNILSFLKIDYDSDLIDLSVKANSAANPKSLLMQKLLYKDNFLKSTIKRFIPDKFIFPLKSRLISLNKNKIVKDDVKYSIQDIINEDYVRWNNEIIIETEKITGLSLIDWKY